MTETRLVVRPVGVTFVNQDQPGEHRAKTAQDRIRVRASGPECLAYFRYVVDVPGGMMLTGAEHDLTLEDDAPGAYTSRRVDLSGLQFGKVTYNNRPDAAAGSVNVDGVKTGTQVVFDVTTDAAAAAADGGRLVLRVSTSAAGDRHFKGARSRRGWPRLVLTFEAYPKTPTDLSPAATVSEAKPWLSWLGHPSADLVQVQVAALDTPWTAESGFTSTLYASGDQPANGGTMNLAEVATAWPGITEGSGVEWSTRQKLPRGWSPWAEPATMPRKALPVGPILNPGPSTADSSFPITWEPPAGQVSWQAIVDIIDLTDPAGTDRQANSGKRNGTDDSWIPDMGGDDPGTVYRIRMRWWDDEDRAATPGAPTYGEATVYTLYEPTDEVAGLAGFSLVQYPGLPAAAASWSRTSGVPDQVEIVAGARTVLGGTESPTQLWTLPPNRALDVVARAVVNGERSAASLTQAFQMAVEGAWVVDPETGRGFVLSGLGLQAGYGSVVTTHTPMTAAALVHRVSARRGLEGTMLGKLKDWPGRTRAQQLEDIWWLRDHPARELRWIGGDLNVPITLVDVWALFDPDLFFTDRTDQHQVQIQFTQSRIERR